MAKKIKSYLSLVQKRNLCKEIKVALKKEDYYNAFACLSWLAMGKGSKEEIELKDGLLKCEWIQK